MSERFLTWREAENGEIDPLFHHQTDISTLESAEGFWVFQTLQSQRFSQFVTSLPAGDGSRRNTLRLQLQFFLNMFCFRRLPVFVCRDDRAYACFYGATILIASCQGQRLAMRGMSVRPSLAAPSADSRESRSLCGSRGGTKTFPPEELWVPVDKDAFAVSSSRVYTVVYSRDLHSSTGVHFHDNKWWLYK